VPSVPREDDIHIQATVNKRSEDSDVLFVDDILQSVIRWGFIKPCLEKPIKKAIGKRKAVRVFRLKVDGNLQQDLVR
jgi:hypothetical protein